MSQNANASKSGFPLWAQIFVGMVLGIIVGTIAGPEYAELLKPIGTLLLTLLKC